MPSDLEVIVRRIPVRTTLTGNGGWPVSFYVPLHPTDPPKSHRATAFGSGSCFFSEPPSCFKA